MDTVWSILRWILGGLFAIVFLISIFFGMRNFWNRIKGNVFGHFKDTIFQILQLLFYTAIFMLVAYYVLPVIFNFVLLRIFPNEELYKFFGINFLISISLWFCFGLLDEIHKNRIDERDKLDAERNILLNKMYDKNLILDQHEELFLSTTIIDTDMDLENRRQRGMIIFIFLFGLFIKGISEIESDFNYFLLFIYFLFTFIVALIGAKRRIGFWYSLILSLFLSPIIGFLITFLTKTNINYEIDEYRKREKGLK